MNNKPSFIEILIVIAIVAIVFLCLFFPIYGFIKYGNAPNGLVRVFCSHELEMSDLPLSDLPIYLKEN